MNTLFQSYLDSFRGLSRPSWMLALVIFINRSGAMVLPFLAIYATQFLGFSLNDAGIVTASFGLGAILGAVLGGWLTDKIGPFKVQVLSLLLSIPMFCILPLFTTVKTLSLGVFVLSTMTDIFRPANSVSVSYYAKPENITRAFSLNRMAINLGFSIGPTLAGFLAKFSYVYLFYGNAIGAGLAAIILYFYFRNKKGNEVALVKKKKTDTIKAMSPYSDMTFILFNILCALFAICFFNLLTTLPLFYKTVHHFSEADIGVLFGFSGLVIVVLEMLIVHFAEKKMSLSQVFVLGSFLCGLSFIMLTIKGGTMILYSAMFVLCISEILVLPFISTATVKRSKKENQGAYMGFSMLSFAVAFVISPYSGTRMISKFGFDILWWSIGLLSVFIAVGFYFVMKKM